MLTINLCCFYDCTTLENREINETQILVSETISIELSIK